MRKSKTKGLFLKGIILLIIVAMFYSTVEIKNSIDNVEILNRK